MQNKLFKLLLIMVLCSTSFVAWAFAANGDYSPLWLTNESWQVAVNFRLPVYDHLSTNVSFTNADVNYTYMVKSSESNEICVQVLPDANSDYALSKWDLHFDPSEMVLKSYTEDKGSSSRPIEANPFGNDAWLFRPGTGLDRIILDFPKISTAGTNEVRVIDKGQVNGKDPFGASLSRSRKDMSDSFVQTLTFSAGSVTSIMSRSNASYEYKVTIVWEKGKKWWKTATISCGTNVLISAALQE